jgi:hypothetical protein
MNPELFNSFCSEIEGKIQRKGSQGVKALKDIFERHTRGGGRGSGVRDEPSVSYLNRLWTMDDALLIGACSHDALFPHVAAVVHHGGAGQSIQSHSQSSDLIPSPARHYSSWLESSKTNIDLPILWRPTLLGRDGFQGNGRA